MQQPQQWRRLLKTRIDNADQKVTAICWERQTHLENILTSIFFNKKKEAKKKKKKRAILQNHPLTKNRNGETKL